MNYRSLLLFLDDDALCPARTRVAIGLARHLDCHLVGLAPTGLVHLPMAMGPTLGDFAAMAADALRDEAEKALGRFRDRCNAAGLRSFEACIDEEDKALSLVRRAHSSDLLIMSQPDPRSPTHRAAQALINDVLLGSARPTLVVPYTAPAAEVGRCVMVAWDDSAESTRAVHDALALLAHARRVRILCWRERRGDADDMRAARLDELRQWLARHGVRADVHLEPATTDIASAILSRAVDIGADLIVMGAWGHTRWAERVLGGATRGILSAMTAPVLMSH